MGGVEVSPGATAMGEPRGRPYDPPLDVAGSNELSFSCSYDNVNDNEMFWGNQGGEMCLLLAFTDSPYKWVGGVVGNLSSLVVGSAGSPNLETGPCMLYTM